jgi:CheY-like chemotaxis protein
MVCKAILENENYRVETMSYCEKVIEDIESFKPDLILLDLWIPSIGGEKALQIIRGNPATTHIPTILFSANDEIEKIYKKLNADSFLRKPFEISDFKKIIAQWIS